MLTGSRWVAVVLAATTSALGATHAAAAPTVDCHAGEFGGAPTIACEGYSPGGGKPGKPLTSEEQLQVYRDQYRAAWDGYEEAETDYDRSCELAYRRTALYNYTAELARSKNSWTEEQFEIHRFNNQGDLDTAAECRGVQEAVRHVVASLGLEPPRIGIVPYSQEGSVGLVGLNNWMWVDQPDATTFGPANATAAIDAWTITVTARVVSVDWDMGDGQVVRCQAGTPYEERFGFDPSPDCGHLYTKQGRYTVTATAHWRADWWAASGKSGVLTIDATTSAPIVIGELQTVRRK